MPSQPAWFHRLDEILTSPAGHDIHPPRPPGGRESLPVHALERAETSASSLGGNGGQGGPFSGPANRTDQAGHVDAG